MDIEPMPGKILRVANAMIRESLLPDFSAANLNSDCVRISTLDQLHRTLQRRVKRRSKQQMHMVRHEHEGMQFESALPAIPV